VGCGFAAFESAGYALHIGLVDPDQMLHNINVRGALAPFSHIVWTAIATSAYWIARKESMDAAQALRSPKFLTLFAAPVVLHFVWNTDFEGPFLLKFWVLGLVAWIIVISLIQSGLHEIGEMYRRDTTVVASGSGETQVDH
jgi:RsiW-degrading membrane proteinase PrsW (M82 family)